MSNAVKMHIASESTLKALDEFFKSSLILIDSDELRWAEKVDIQRASRIAGFYLQANQSDSAELELGGASK